MKDEAEHFERTARSLIQQTHRPLRWLVVDDGSSDATATLAEEYAAAHSWISVIRRTPGMPRARGGAVISAFNEGLADVNASPAASSDLIAKLDGDLYLPPHYFEWVAATFKAESAAGIVGGRLMVPEAGSWVFDAVNPTNVHGAIKTYSRDCFESIGGLHESMGWDGIDEYAARARGWKVVVLSELPALHYAPRGSKQGWFRPRWEEGRGSHWIGYIWPMALIRVAFRMAAERPPIIGGLILGVSFLWHRASRSPQVADHLAIAQVQADQRRDLRAMATGRRHADLGPPAPGPAYFATGKADNSPYVRPTPPGR